MEEKSMHVKGSIHSETSYLDRNGSVMLEVMANALCYRD